MEELEQTVYGYGVGVYAMWTGLLLEAHELGVLKLAWSGSAIRSAGDVAWWRETREARALARIEIRGCLYGPWAWLAARTASGERARP